MARARIPREVLADRLRNFVLKWRKGQAWEVAEDKGGSIMHQFQAELGPEFGVRGEWEMQVGSISFLMPEEHLDVYDLLWSYVEAGILRPVTGSFNSQSREAWGELHLTDHGRQILEGAAPLPEDVAAYLDRLGRDAPQLDNTARFYVEQALRAFRAKLFPASAVMLGCAAEHVVEKLAHGLVPKLPPASRVKLEKGLDQGPVSEVWKLFRALFEQHRSGVFAPHGSVRTSETGLDGLFLVVKRARDDGGHPTEVHLTENEARTLLQVFLEHARYASVALDGIAKLPDV